MKKTTFNRRLFLIITVITFVILVVGYLYVVKQRQDDVIQRAKSGAINQQRGSFSALNDIKGDSLASLARDYSYWDDMVDFAASGDPVWATENLETTQKTFDTQGIWVYNKSGTLVYSFVEQDGDLKKNQPLSVPIDKVMKVLDQQKKIHFYFQQQGVTYEVRAATIQPTNDPDAITPARGYFFAGRRIDQDYLSNITKPIDASAKVVLGVNTQTSTPSRVDDSVIFFDLLDWNGKSMGQIQVASNLPVISDLVSVSATSLYIQIIFITILFVLVIALLYFFIKSRQNALSEVGKSTAVLKESEFRFKIISESTSLGILLFDTDEICIYSNPASKKILGPKVDVKDLKLSELLGIYHSKEDIASWIDDTSMLDSMVLEVSYTATNKRKVWLNYTVSKVLNNKVLEEYLVVIEDITSTKDRYKNIEEKNSDLESINKTMIDREIKMAELKAEIAKLKGKSDSSH